MRKRKRDSMSAVYEYYKAVDMTLIDWFATFAPEPDKEEVELQRLYDLNKAHHDHKFVARDERTIRCELRYAWAKAMMRAR
jgi:hypothetical protein